LPVERIGERQAPGRESSHPRIARLRRDEPAFAVYTESDRPVGIFQISRDRLASSR
jgi:hypothetical protein